MLSHSKTGISLGLSFLPSRTSRNVGNTFQQIPPMFCSTSWMYPGGFGVIVSPHDCWRWFVSWGPASCIVSGCMHCIGEVCTIPSVVCLSCVIFLFSVFSIVSVFCSCPCCCIKLWCCDPFWFCQWCVSSVCVIVVPLWLCCLAFWWWLWVSLPEGVGIIFGCRLSGCQWALCLFLWC